VSTPPLEAVRATIRQLEDAGLSVLSDAKPHAAAAPHAA
jgi:hypothetical protein